MTDNLPANIDLPALTADELAEQAGVTHAVALVRQALVVMDDLRLAHPTDPDGLARLLQVARILERDLISLRRDTHLDLFHAMTDKQMDIDGVGRIEAKQGRSRKVHDIGAVDGAILRHAIYDDDGERITFDEDEVAARTLDLTKQVYGITASRLPSVTKVDKVLGLDLDDVSDWVDGSPTVVLPPIPQ